MNTLRNEYNGHDCDQVMIMHLSLFQELCHCDVNVGQKPAKLTMKRILVRNLMFYMNLTTVTIDTINQETQTKDTRLLHGCCMLVRIVARLLQGCNMVVIRVCMVVSRL